MVKLEINQLREELYTTLPVVVDMIKNLDHKESWPEGSAQLVQKMDALELYRYEKMSKPALEREIKQSKDRLKKMKQDYRSRTD